MKKKLVFHFYIKNDWVKLPIVSLHLKLLRHYANFFDESLFVISVDDVDDFNLIQKIETTIVGIGFTNVKFKVIKNDKKLREVITYYNDFVKEFEAYDGLLYFAHIKGVYDTTGMGMSYDAISHWVTTMYYQLFSEPLYHTLADANNKYIVGGANKTIVDSEFRDFSFYGKYGWYYCGTFIVVNCPKIREWAKRKNVNLLLPVTGKYYSEQYVTYMIPIELGYGKCVAYPDLNCVYENSKWVIDLNFNGKERDDYLKFYNKIQDGEEVNISISCD